MQLYTITPDFDCEYDVIVAGLGTTGSMAAICAAENGLSVLGIERLTGMGGTGTYGCVWDYYFGSPGGRFESVNDECREYAKGRFLTTNRKNDGEGLSGTVKSYILERTAMNAGCTLWYETVVTGAYMEGNSLAGLVCLKKGRLISVRAKMTIDCTGEAAICRIIGAESFEGRTSDNLGQQFSKAVGIISGDFIRGVWKHCGRMEKHDAETLSRRIIKAASEPPCLLDHYSGENRAVYEGAILGLREAPHVITDEYLTLEDHFSGRKTDSPLFYAFSQVDNVNRDIAFESRAYQDWHFICSMYCYGISVGVPLGAMIPKGYDGLLAAGKSMGTDHDMASCVRMKKDLEKCGEAAAAAAYLKIRDDVHIRDVPMDELRAMLGKSGCLDKSNDYGIADLRKPAVSIPGQEHTQMPEQVMSQRQDRYQEKGQDPRLSLKTSRAGMPWDRTGEYRESAILLTDPEDIKSVLSSDYPGFAYWSIKNIPADIIVPTLFEWSRCGTEPLSSNSKIALGLLGVPEAAALLREMLFTPPRIPAVHDRPIYYPDHARMICLLGRLRDKYSAEILLDIVETCASKYLEHLETDSYYSTKDDFAFLFVSTAIVSLTEIAKAEANSRTSGIISSRLLAWAARDDISFVISMGKVEMSPVLKTYIIKNLHPDSVSTGKSTLFQLQ
ncbi:MAG: FAD-dependent oxidoreductase [Eubacteriales bacterium]|nr:FAD-dependent oxidoreductase [Eubacteriales bacterium]